MSEVGARRKYQKVQVVRNHAYWKCDVKWCSLCEKHWPFEYFYRGRSHGCSTWCKRCTLEWVKKRLLKPDRKELLDKIRERRRAAYKKNPRQKINYYKNRARRLETSAKWYRANVSRVQEKNRERRARLRNTHLGVLQNLYRSLKFRAMRGLPIPPWQSFKEHWLLQSDFIAYAQFRLDARKLTPYKRKKVSALYEHRRIFMCTKIWSTNPCDYILTRPPRRGVSAVRNINAEGYAHAH